MTHNEKRTVWWKEGLAAAISGLTYGISNTMVGHPLDTVKTKMQVVPEYKNLSSLQSIKYLNTTEGKVGFYRGLVPPLIGSSIFRALQFASFEAFYTKAESYPILKTEIPFSLGLQIRVIIGGLISGSARALVEAPFEYMKIKKQTLQNYKYRNLYQGFLPVLLRSCGLMTTYFSLVDSFRRNTNLYNYYYGIFILNGCCSTIAFSVVWPLEVAKNNAQSLSSNSNETKQFSIIKFLRQRVKEQGVIKGLYRGSLPGLASVFLRNGAAMIAMVNTQKFLTKLGFRN